MREKEGRVEKLGRFFCFDTMLKDSDMPPLLAVKNLSCVWPEGGPMFENINFNVNEGDIIVLQARSGTGCVAFLAVSSMFIIIVIIAPRFFVRRKTTLLKCIAHLYLYYGTVEFRGK